VSPVKYELGFYIPEDDILHSHCRENLTSDMNMLAKSAKHLNCIQRIIGSKLGRGHTLWPAVLHSYELIIHSHLIM
jgi:hypothetical protein